MKKLLLIFAMVATSGLFFACSKDDDGPGKNTAEFDSKLYTLPSNGDVYVKVRMSSPVTEATVIPVSVAGSAAENDDYFIEKKEFTIAPGKNVDSIKISANNNVTPDREIRLNLQGGAAYAIGNNAVTIVSVLAKEEMRYSFAAAKSEVVNTTEITVTITGAMSGKNFKASADIHLPIEIVNTSTAAENTDYTLTFAGSTKEVVIPKNGNTAVFTITAVEGSPNLGTANPPVVKLKINAPGESDPLHSLYEAGNNETTEIKVTGKLKPSAFVGTWALDASAEDAGFPNLNDVWGLNTWKEFLIYDVQGDPDVFPANNSVNDKFTITAEAGDTYKFTPSMTGDMANYFRECTFDTPVADKFPSYGAEDYYIPLTYYTFSKVNYKFSKTKTDEKAGQVGFRFDDNGDLLLYIHSYTPTDWLPGVYQKFLEYGLDQPGNMIAEYAFDRFFSIVYRFKKQS